MKSNQLAASVAFGWVVFTMCPAWAHGVAAKSNEPVTMTDKQIIEHAMKALFDKPGASLKVAPVSVEGAYAVAGWIQTDRGGRALLKKESGKWSIQVCGGDGLKQVSTLTMTGMDQASAGKLAQKIAAAEKQMTSDQIKKFAMFEGVVKVDGGAHDPHTANHGHTSHSK
ncbi:MAG: hypothetical protein RL300_1927 [Pseudomonadota bacterium]|jgi:hypothetical protein